MLNQPPRSREGHTARPWERGLRGLHGAAASARRARPTESHGPHSKRTHRKYARVHRDKTRPCTRGPGRPPLDAVRQRELVCVGVRATRVSAAPARAGCATALPFAALRRECSRSRDDDDLGVAGERAHPFTHRASPSAGARGGSPRLQADPGSRPRQQTPATVPPRQRSPPPRA